MQANRNYSSNPLRGILGIYCRPCKGRYGVLEYGMQCLFERNDALLINRHYQLITIRKTRNVRRETQLILLPRCYYTQSAGLQLFHCLENTDPKGGDTLLVDGFRAAKEMRVKHPNGYKLLSGVPMPYFAAGDPHHFFEYRAAPVLTHDLSGELVQVRWNNDDRSTIDDFAETGESMDKFYQAMRDWMEIITSQESEYWSRLEPGRALIFDNWRVVAIL